eukprot:353827-Chlamydomonas_euryale.AAC.5
MCDSSLGRASRHRPSKPARPHRRAVSRARVLPRPVPISHTSSATDRTPRDPWASLPRIAAALAAKAASASLAAAEPLSRCRSRCTGGRFGTWQRLRAPRFRCRAAPDRSCGTGADKGGTGAQPTVEAWRIRAAATDHARHQAAAPAALSTAPAPACASG